MPTKILTTVFECSSELFLKYFSEHTEPTLENKKIYYNKWLEKYNAINIPSLPFSSVFIIEKIFKTFTRK